MMKPSDVKKMEKNSRVGIMQKEGKVRKDGQTCQYPLLHNTRRSVNPRLSQNQHDLRAMVLQDPTHL